MKNFLVGVDLGQMEDYTALAVVEKSEDGDRPTYAVRHLHRFPLRTSYATIVRHVATIMRRPPLWDYAALIVDATGVGAPVVDELREAGLEPIAVKIHGGDNVSRDEEGAWKVPKRVLASTVQVLLQSDRLGFADALPDVSVLVHELTTFKATISPAGHDTYEAWRERDHDDYVFAVALPCWYGESHAGIPVFRDHFTIAHHVSESRVTPQPGIPIVRGWRTAEPPAVVWFQVTDARRVRVLYEIAPAPGVGLAAVKEKVLIVSQTLFPEFTFVDIGEAPDSRAGSGTAADLLRPDVSLVGGEMSIAKRLEVARHWLGKIVRGTPAVEIDPGCVRLIRALAGGYVFKQVRGKALGEPEENPSSHVVDAWLCALANPVATMTPVERSRLMGPRDLSAWMR